MLMLEREVGQRILIGDDVSLELLGVVFTDRRGRVAVALDLGERRIITEWVIGQRVTLDDLGVELLFTRITRRHNGYAAVFGLEAPDSVEIWRDEVYERIQKNGGVPRKSLRSGGAAPGALGAEIE